MDSLIWQMEVLRFVDLLTFQAVKAKSWVYHYRGHYIT